MTAEVSSPVSHPIGENSTVRLGLVVAMLAFAVGGAATGGAALWRLDALETDVREVKAQAQTQTLSTAVELQRLRSSVEEMSRNVLAMERQLERMTRTARDTR